MNSRDLATLQCHECSTKRLISAARLELDRLLVHLDNIEDEVEQLYIEAGHEYMTKQKGLKR